jgi:hypothetical protein
MEMQIKSRLSKVDYLKMCKLFEKENNSKRINQTNNFFDGENNEL